MSASPTAWVPLRGSRVGPGRNVPSASERTVYVEPPAAIVSARPSSSRSPVATWVTSARLLCMPSSTTRRSAPSKAKRAEQAGQGPPFGAGAAAAIASVRTNGVMFTLRSHVHELEKHYTKDGSHGRRRAFAASVTASFGRPAAGRYTRDLSIVAG